MKILLLFSLTLFISACGVKGDPLPPEKPAELGRGRPTYRRAMKDVKLSPVEDPEDENKPDIDDKGENE